MNNLGLVLDQPGLSCNHLVATNLLWDTFGAFLGRPLGDLWAHFVAYWGPLEPPWAISERFFIETSQYERILGDPYLYRASLSFSDPFPMTSS